MNILLWILQILLGAVFLWHGLLYLFPPTELIETMNAQIAVWVRIFIGIAEILAAIGLILPSLTRILPWLTSLAATGLMIVTASATVFHVSRGEMGIAIMPIVLFVLVSFVAYRRWKVQAILPRDTMTPQAPKQHT
jgi:putative oxidoreductase